MTYEPKNFDQLIGTAGFSDALLKNHFTLYQGYVSNFNKLNDALAELAKAGKLGTPEYAELKRRAGWEFNGIRLHELYFANMTKTSAALDKTSSFYKKLLGEFGSFDGWLKEFKATATMRGIGWTILYHDPEADRLFNVWITEHDLGHFAGCRPLLVLDVFEHAYILDYGLKRAEYIEAFFKAVDWQTVTKRFQ